MKRLLIFLLLAAGCSTGGQIKKSHPKPEPEQPREIIQDAPTWTPFNDPENRLHEERIHNFDVLHYSFHVTVDETPGKVKGEAEITFTSTVDALKTLDIDASDMAIGSVHNGKGTKLTYTHNDPSLSIVLSDPLPQGEKRTVKITWNGTPTTGMFWVLPDKEHPDKPFQIWTQGETEYTHHWLPCYDYPNDKATVEMRVTVPKKYYGLSNGVLLGEKAEGNWKTYHWKEETPYSIYLTTCVVGEFDIYEDTYNPGNIPVRYLVPKGKFTEQEVRDSLGMTPEMMKFYGENIGLQYPYGKYDTVAVWDFIWGGMENVTATTMYQWVVTPSALKADRDAEGLIAHELVHHWFGDLLTTRTWKHIWLNEGFASYFDQLWFEHSRGKDDLAMDMDGSRSWHMGQRKQYDRPVCCDVYTRPMDLFDSFIYGKGAWVLHMLRDVVGDSAWWRGIRAYVKRHYAKYVTTDDLQKAMEEAYGKPLDWFFDQWVHKTSVPAFKVTRHWDEDYKQLRLVVNQTQETNERVPIFRVPIDIEIAAKNKSGEIEKKVYRIWSTKRSQEFYFVLDAEPFQVRFDLENKVLKTIEFDKPQREWIYQIKSGTNAATRVEAARALAEMEATSHAIEALKGALQDKHYWVQREAARALGELTEPAARDALLEAVSIANPRVRRVVLSSLGTWANEEKVATVLEKAVREDESWMCRRDAAAAYGHAGTDAYDFLLAALNTQKGNEWVAPGIIHGLANTGEARSVTVFLAYSAYGHSQPVRRAAVQELAARGKGRDDVLDRLVELLKDREFRVVGQAVGALREFGDPRAVPGLRELQKRTFDERMRKNARRTADQLEEK